MAAKALRVRELTAEEVETVRRLAHSRTESARLVERARMVWLAAGGRTVPMIAAELGVGADTVRLWLKRFNAEGSAGLRVCERIGHDGEMCASGRWTGWRAGDQLIETSGYGQFEGV
jgi:Homeodomain-like domain